MTLLERLVAIRTGGAVERCHGHMHQGSYSVAAHSWGMAMLLYLLWPEDFRRLVIYCLVHDIPEAWIGDIPAPVKKYAVGIRTACAEMERIIFERLKLPNDADLSLADQAKLRACDHLELYLWTCEQLMAGNQHVRCIKHTLEDFFVREPLSDRAADLFLHIQSGAIVQDTGDLIREINGVADVRD